MAVRIVDVFEFIQKAVKTMNCASGSGGCVDHCGIIRLARVVALYAAKARGRNRVLVSERAHARTTGGLGGDAAHLSLQAGRAAATDWSPCNGNYKRGGRAFWITSFLPSTLM